MHKYNLFNVNCDFYVRYSITTDWYILSISSCVCVCVCVYILCRCLVVKWYPTLCNPMNCSLSGSSVHRISHARIWECSWLRDWTHISCIGMQILYCWATREAHLCECMCVCVCECECDCVCVLCSIALVMSDSLQLLGLPPTRLLDPWDSPGKNTGVGLSFPSYIYITPNFIKATLLNHPLTYISLSFVHKWTLNSMVLQRHYPTCSKNGFINCHLHYKSEKFKYFLCIMILQKWDLIIERPAHCDMQFWKTVGHFWDSKFGK